MTDQAKYTGMRMELDLNNLDIVNNTQASRFEAKVGDKVAMVQYSIADENIIFTHTEVPVEFKGHGIANKMAKVALDWAVSEGYKIQPVCPFIKSYVQRHEEYHSMSSGFGGKRTQNRS